MTSIDGHTSPTTKTMKETGDESFQYALTWITGGRDKGWTTHYAPRHRPISPEVEAALTFLGLQQFPTCPVFDFEPCHWRFTPFVEQGVMESNAEWAHRYFDAHAEHFASGIEQLLTAERAVELFGMSILPKPLPAPDLSRHRLEPAPASRLPKLRVARDYPYDVAVSFAGTERELAKTLATQLRDAGFVVFYDDFYPEQLWGKDLPVFFDQVYREQSRFCVVFVSQEYTERMWTNHERQSAVARAMSQKGQDYLLPIKVDDVQLPGVAPTLGYLSLDNYSVDTIAQLLITRLQRG